MMPRVVISLIYITLKELIRKKDIYVLLIFMTVLLGLFSSQSFFNIEGVSRYIRDIGYTLMMTFALIISVIYSARQLPSEVETKTIYPLLAKPLSRRSVILGKYFGALTVSILSYFVFFLVFLLFSVFFAQEKDLILLGQAFLSGVLFLSMVSAIVIFNSNYLTFSANVTLSFLLYILVTGFADGVGAAAMSSAGLLSFLLGALYSVIPHLEFYDMRVRITHSWPPVPFWVLASVTVYTVLYCAMLLYISGIMFDRRKL